MPSGVKALISILAGCSYGGGGGGGRTAVPQPSRAEGIYKKTRYLLLSLILLSLLWCGSQVTAQQKPRLSIKDSIDGKVDLSSYLTEAHGFVPLPIVITEPALGGFGGALAPVFIKRRPPYLDSVRGGLLVTPVAPDVTGGIGAYTVNNSWVVAAFRSGSRSCNSI